jgi:WD40 repeat protein
MINYFTTKTFAGLGCLTIGKTNPQSKYSGQVDQGYLMMIVCRFLECQSERFITCFCSDSETIVVGGTWKNWRKPLVFTYRVVDMSKHLTLEDHSGTVTGVVMSAEVIVSGGADRQVILWRREDGVKIAVLTDHQLGVTALA